MWDQGIVWEGKSPENVCCCFQPVDWSWNQYADQKFQFMDHLLVANVKSKKDKDAMEFFKLLSLCHTVMVDNKDGNSGSMPLANTKSQHNAWAGTSQTSFKLRLNGWTQGCRRRWKWQRKGWLLTHSALVSRWSGVPGCVSWWGRSGDCSEELRFCVPVSNAGHDNHHGDGAGKDLWNAGSARLQLWPQAHVYHLYEHTHTHTHTLASDQFSHRKLLCWEKSESRCLQET